MVYLWLFNYLKHVERLSKKIFFSRKKKRLLTHWVIRPILTIHLILSVWSYYRNTHIHTNDYAAIYVTDRNFAANDSWASPLACVGAYPYWNAYFNDRGLKTEWFFSRNERDLQKLVQSHRFQQIVVFGYSNKNQSLSLQFKIKA